MDSTKCMIIAKGKICTHQIKSIKYNPSIHMYDLIYMSGKRYSYSWGNVSYLRDPVIIPVKNSYLVTPEGRRFSDVRQIYEFDDKGTKYWHFVSSGKGYDYLKSDVRVFEAGGTDNIVSISTFDYLKEISDLSEIPNDNGEIILRKYYEAMAGVPNATALFKYLNPSVSAKDPMGVIPIFPFGCNESQYKAVSNALSHQISIIQGPPGTGKTQTILNIIANLLLNNKSVIVVSNNNAAIGNVLEKLSNEKYRMDFLAAFLGNSENRNAFIESQTGKYPDLHGWEIGMHPGIMRDLIEASKTLHKIYECREELAILKEQKQEIELEYKHFDEYLNQVFPEPLNVKYKPLIPADKVLKSFHKLQQIADESKDISKWFVFKNRFIYGIGDKAFYKQDLSILIPSFQKTYYLKSLDELNAKIEELDNELSGYPMNIEKESEMVALSLLRAHISRRYNWKDKREIYSDKTMFSKADRFMHEYPVVLSTTFSARACLNPKRELFDYVIMDEASQVDIATGALALSVAKNAVIVGDTKQLPNVLTEDTRKKAEEIRAGYHIREAYDFTKHSFLSSVEEALPDAPVTLLREHYRCHPKIITFCNRKFYKGELLIMTQDNGSDDALKAVKTVRGNHSRGHYNQRQIDIIRDEILPGLDTPNEEIGIIAPYNAQVNQLKKQIPGIDIATVHKFQGREKDVIILSTVDDEIGDFTDDPYLLNVAVSRARKKLIVVVSGNEQSNKGNIVDLVSYIRYNNMEVVDSRVYSVFDFLYSQNAEDRWKYLKGKKRISQYDSENLTYNLLLDVLKDYPEYGVQCFEPLSMIVRDLSLLSDEEKKYLRNPATHLDFLIYNKVNKQPVLAVETDGYKYHKEGTEQHERDLKKNHILEVAGIPIVRLSTVGSNERERILCLLK